jgi:hypothetical protein
VTRASNGALGGTRTLGRPPWCVSGLQGLTSPCWWQPSTEARRNHCVSTLRSEGGVSREQQLSNIAITDNWPTPAPIAESLATIRERSRMTIGGYRGASAIESTIALGTRVLVREPPRLLQSPSREYGSRAGRPVP